MIKELPKNRLILFSIIILLMAIYFHSYFDTYSMPARGDESGEPDSHTTDLMAILGVYPMEIRKIFDEYHQFPFWSPYRMSGTPIFSKPQATFFYIDLPFILYAPTIFAGIKWSIMLHFLIGAIGMYALMHYLSNDELTSFVASFIYTFNAYLISRLNWGQINIIHPNAWVPLIFLFTFFAIEKKEWILNSIFLGIFFSMTVLGGGAQQFMYLSVIYFYFLAVYTALNFSRSAPFSNIIKIGRMSFIVLIVFFGLTAVFIFPNKDLVNASVRSQGYSYEQSLGAPYEISFGLIKDLATPTIFKKPMSDWNSSGIGLVAALMILPALLSFRKKKFLLFAISLLILILVLHGTFLFKIFWNLIPQFRQAKGIFKGHYLIIFFATIIASYGFLAVSSKLKKLDSKKRTAILGGITLLIAVNLTIFNNKLTMMTDVNFELQKNEILQNISKDRDLFRFHIFETKGIDWGTDHYSVLLGLNDVYGTENIWPIEYLPMYLGFANQNMAKGYGILNTKYILSTTELNISNYKFVNKFNECGLYPNGADICQPKKSDGPYLYLNEKFLPRAYFVNKSILVIGEKEQSVQITYYLMQQDKFNPAESAVVQLDNLVDNLDQSFLESFDAVVLGKNSLGSSYENKLKKYVNNGGILIPDITNGKTSLGEAELNDALGAIFDEDFRDITIKGAKILTYSPNEIIIDTDSKNGLLVISELFTLYPGWKAYDENGKGMGILRADGVISAIHLSGQDRVYFKYREPSFRKGAIISLTTLLLIASYLSYYCLRKWKIRKSDPN